MHIHMHIHIHIYIHIHTIIQHMVVIWPQLEPSTMLHNSDGQLRNHWAGLKVWYRWICKTIEFCLNGKCMKNWIMFYVLYSHVIRLHHLVSGLIFITFWNIPWYCIICKLSLYPAMNTLGTLMTSAVTDVINHNGRKIGRFKPRQFC